MKKSIKYNKHYTIIINDSEKYSDEEIKDTLKEAMKSLRKHELKDIPVQAPEESVEIQHNEKITGGKKPLTITMVETAFKERDKDNGMTFNAYVDEMIKDLDKDLENASLITSNERKSNRMKLLEDYIILEKLCEKAGLFDKQAEIKEKCDKLSETLHLNSWKEPNFTPRTHVIASNTLRKKHKNDSRIIKKMTPVFLCTPTALKESYIDAKNGKMPEVFEANLFKVERDMKADYDRIMQGIDTYVEDPYISQTLPEIVNHYKKALQYAEALEYKNYVDSFNIMLPVIEKEWGLAAL